MLRDAKLRFDPLSPTVRWTTIAAVMLCGVLAAGLRGPGSQRETFAGETSVSRDTIVEGVGCGDVRVGMSRPDMLKALGQPDPDSAPDWLKWRKQHIECSFHRGSEVVSEVRFDPGFAAALANGLKVGGPADQVLTLYGKASFTKDRGNGAKQFEFSEKGILFWTYQGKITQIVVFKPYNAKGGEPDFTPVATTPAARAPIIEGVGCGKVQVGMSREDLLKALGEPDGDSTPDWLRWRQKRIECTFHRDSTVVSEVRFNPGFSSAMANGLKLGGPGEQVQKIYGEPSFRQKRSNGAQELEYSEKGILFWTYGGRITQIVVFQPYVLKKASK
jgi:hypothetical protein